jgi:hypothetical protein
MKRIKKIWKMIKDFNYEVGWCYSSPWQGTKPPYWFYFLQNVYSALVQHFCRHKNCESYADVENGHSETYCKDCGMSWSAWMS